MNFYETHNNAESLVACVELIAQKPWWGNMMILQSYNLHEIHSTVAKPDIFNFVYTERSE